MRIYKNCKEAVKEVGRDLFEMGIEVQTYSMQDKVVEGDPDFFTQELSPYMFMITDPLLDPESFMQHIFPEDWEGQLKWCYLEIRERTSDSFLNPGTAWEIRNEVWAEYIHEGTFAYSYNDRIRVQLPRIITELRNKPGTRQAIVNIHSNFRGDIDKLGGGSRVPCSMHYQFLLRNEKLDLIYVMRSSDYLTHFCNDNWLAIALLGHVCKETGYKPGNYTFTTGSLHAYHKDLKTRGIF